MQGVTLRIEKNYIKYSNESQHCEKLSLKPETSKAPLKSFMNLYNTNIYHCG